MSKFAPAAMLLLSFFVLLPEASAQATRTWVSGVGDDVNPCSRTAPCKTFAGAISKTATGGEISVLDPGGFGAVTISKSITIDGAGGYGSINHAGTAGIIINSATANVVLRNLSLTGGTSGTDSIRVSQALRVHLENVVIGPTTGSGVKVNQAGVDQPEIIMNHVKIRLVGSAGTDPVLHSGAYLHNARASLNDVTISGAPFGVFADGSSIVNISNSTFANLTTALSAVGDAVINVERSVVTHSTTAASATAPALIRLSDVMTGFNVTALVGNIASFGNNRIAAGNTTDGAPTATLPQQ